MDRLKTPLPEFLRQQANLIVAQKNAKEKGRLVDEVGQQMMHAAALQQVKQRKSRRTDSEAYLHRCADEQGKRTGEITLDNFEQIGPRWVKDAHEAYAHIKNRGWFTDDFCDDTLIGVVLCMTRHGAPDTYDSVPDGAKEIYLAGTRHSQWDGVTLGTTVYDTVRDAAYGADSMAEREAETCREYDEQFRREERWGELAGQIKKARQKCLKLLRDMRPIRKGLIGAPASICEALRDQVECYLADIRGWRKERSELV